MTRLISHIKDFDIAALSPTNSRFYERLGWQIWRGQLAVRTDKVYANAGRRSYDYRLPTHQNLI
jgi:predicted acetyltransferase